jgi:hypothetical protein
MVPLNQTSQKSGMVVSAQKTNIVESVGIEQKQNALELK